MIFKMRKNKPSNFITYIIYAAIILVLPVFIYSCEKKEPAVQPNTEDIMVKVAKQFPEYDNNNSRTVYKSNDKNKELSDKTAVELYSDDKNKPIDLSKIEQYSIIKADDAEIGIFKLYDKTNSEYVKEMSRTRISKMQSASNEITNDAETRSYGNYVYYVSHPQKDKIFEIIENSLKGV